MITQIVIAFFAGYAVLKGREIYREQKEEDRKLYEKQKEIDRLEEKKKEIINELQSFLINLIRERRLLLEIKDNEQSVEQKIEKLKESLENNKDRQDGGINIIVLFHLYFKNQSELYLKFLNTSIKWGNFYNEIMFSKKDDKEFKCFLNEFDDNTENMIEVTKEFIKYIQEIEELN